MSRLTCYKITENEREKPKPKIDTSNVDEIQAIMASINMGFERWQTSVILPPGAGQGQILATYAREIDALCQRGGYQSVDVVRMYPDHPDRIAMREKFLHEHIHDDDEVRFFVEGAGAFYIRDQHMVYRMRCDAGDLLVVPKATRHWFDMGHAPMFCAIRLFTTPDGWQARFTGDRIADRTPGLDA